MACDERPFLRRMAATVAVVLAVTACAPEPATAETVETFEAALTEGAQVLRIRDHRGGFLPQVVAEVTALNGAGVAGRIDGAYCFSACTVYLALDDVCVAPWTQFGFHAPRDPRTGRVVTGQAFDHATLHVAGYYRPRLAAWWLQHGRFVHNGMAFRSGAELIGMGYRACAPSNLSRAG